MRRILQCECVKKNPKFLHLIRRNKCSAPPKGVQIEGKIWIPYSSTPGSPRPGFAGPVQYHCLQPLRCRACRPLLWRRLVVGAGEGGSWVEFALSCCGTHRGGALQMQGVDADASPLELVIVVQASAAGSNADSVMVGRTLSCGLWRRFPFHRIVFRACISPNS